MKNGNIVMVFTSLISHNKIMPELKGTYANIVNINTKWKLMMKVGHYFAPWHLLVLALLTDRWSLLYR